MVSVRNVFKRFGDLEVLKGVSLEVEKGEVVSIIGASGSGKSTLLRCINRLEEVTEGEIFFENEEVTGDKKNVRELRSRMGMVFQNFNLFKHMTIMKNMIYPQIHVKKVPRAEAIEKAKKLLDRVGLLDKADVYPVTLSGGQQQRVAIARALIKNPKLLLCDELTGALDTKSSRHVLQFIEKVNKQFGTTIVIITHNEAIAGMADSIIRIKDGRIASNEKNENKLSAQDLEL